MHAEARTHLYIYIYISRLLERSDELDKGKKGDIEKKKSTEEENEDDFKDSSDSSDAEE